MAKTKHDLRLRAKCGQDVKDGLTTSGGKICARQACSSSSWRCRGYGLLKKKNINQHKLHFIETRKRIEKGGVSWLGKTLGLVGRIHTGAMVRLATTAASGTFEKVLVVVVVVFMTWTKAVAPIFSPPPEQEVKPR